MDIDAYLSRINYCGSRAPTAENLRQLQVAHLRSVPFENLSIHAGEPIILADDRLFAKVVERRRGGFCYELNGLFAALLRALGFEVVMLSAGVMHPSGEFGPDFDHMTLLVTLEQRWLVDVGFGYSLPEPLLLDEREEQAVTGGRAYRIDPAPDGHLILMRRKEGDWIPQYRLGLEPHVYADYAAMCHYHQTAPESPFTKHRVCSMVTPGGRVTLTQMRLITVTDGVRQERELAGEAEYAAALREHFGIALP